MTQKVQVSREVADAINKRLEWDTPAEIVNRSARNGWEERGNNSVGILNARNTDLDTLIRALYYGYEVDETPEEKWSRYLENLRSHSFIPVCVARANTIEEMAKDFGLKIEGVNA